MSRARLHRELSEPQLREFILTLGRSLAQERQVGKRLAELLPRRERALIKEYQGRWGLEYRRALRLALVDERFSEYVEEYLKARYGALESQVLYQTHKMLLFARRQR